MRQTDPKLRRSHFWSQTEAYGQARLLNQSSPSRRTRCAAMPVAGSGIFQTLGVLLRLAPENFFEEVRFSFPLFCRFSLVGFFVARRTLPGVACSKRACACFSVNGRSLFVFVWQTSFTSPWDDPHFEMLWSDQWRSTGVFERLFFFTLKLALD